MKEMKQDRKSKYTRMVLQDSLMELMHVKPITKITVKEICAHADINRTTFYTHYGDPYDLLHVIEDTTLAWAEEMLERLLESDKQGAMRIIENIFAYFVENSHHIQILMSEQGDIEFQKKLLSLIYSYCSKTLADPQQKNYSDEVNEFHFVFAVSGSVGIIQHWLKTGLQASPKEMAETIYHMVFHSGSFYF